MSYIIEDILELCGLVAFVCLVMFCAIAIGG